MSLANIQGKLSRTEMKNIMAGSGDTVECNDGTSHLLPSGDCSQGSSGECNGHLGVKDCVAYGHPIT